MTSCPACGALKGERHKHGCLVRLRDQKDVVADEIAPQPQVTVGNLLGIKDTQPERLYGWVCPLCRRVHAPWLEQCGCTAISLKGAIA